MARVAGKAGDKEGHKWSGRSQELLPNVHALMKNKLEISGCLHWKTILDIFKTQRYLALQGQEYKILHLPLTLKVLLLTPE